MLTLDDICADLTARAQSVLVRLKARSGYPPLLMHDNALNPDEVRYDWTNTDLAVVRVADHFVDDSCMPQQVLARLCGLDQIAEGLPTHLRPRNESELHFSTAVMETATLVRGLGVYKTVESNIGPYLSPTAAAHVSTLKGLLARQQPVHKQELTNPQHRLAALLVASGAAADPALLRLVTMHWPRVVAKSEEIIAARPIIAANSTWKWALNSLKNPHPATTWVQKSGRDSQARRASIRVIKLAAHGVLASCGTNSKGSSFSPRALAQLAQYLRKNPLVYYDHDRSRPPEMILLNVQYHCHGEEHEVSGLVGALTEAAAARLRSGGGFSPGMHLGG